MFIKIFSLLFGFPAMCILLLALGQNAYAINLNNAVHKSLQSLRPDSELPVIIHLSDKADVESITDKERGIRTTKIIRALKENARMTQTELRSFLEMKKVNKIQSLWIINAIATVVPIRFIPELEHFPGIESVVLDSTVQAPVTEYGSAALPEWNLEAVQAPDFWKLGYTGAGVTVATMDTGVDIHHPDLESKWRGGASSWYDPAHEHILPYDANGHGTQTTGIMVGGSSGGTAIGVAPGAQWIGVKIFNDAGESTLSRIHLGFQWLLDPDGNPDTHDTPDVVNASWGIVESSGQCVLDFQQDIQNLRAAGIAVIFAAGNSGPPVSPLTNTSESPANNPGSFPVGAVDSNKTIASFSSRGPSACDGGIFPHVVAPGVDIRTSDLTAGGVFPDSYRNVTGTSFAAPHVAGAIALLVNAFPDRTINDILSALEQSSVDLGTPEADNAYGYGLIDILKAYNALLADNNTSGPRIGVTPASFDFGDYESGTSSSPVSFLFTNTGSADLRIGLVSFAGTNPDNFKMLSDDCSGRTIGPQLSCAVEIYFTPLSSGAKNANLSVSSNDPVTPLLTVPLVGTGLTPQPLTVISPNGSENWTAGTTQTIRWKYTGDPGRFIHIELLQGGALIKTIKSRISPGNGGNGSCTWTIPSKQNPGDTYRIRIRSKANVFYADTSDADFLISPPPPPSITVTIPDGGEIWQRGTSQTIHWTSAGKTGTRVKIQLLKDGAVNRTLSSSVKTGSDGNGSFNWTIPNTLTPGDNYQIKIISTSKGAIHDSTNGTFTIQ